MSRPSPTRVIKDTSYPVGSWGWQTAQHAEKQAVIA
jgi:hypothetical protein